MKIDNEFAELFLRGAEHYIQNIEDYINSHDKAILKPMRKSMWNLLDRFPTEAQTLLEAFEAGTLDGQYNCPLQIIGNKSGIHYAKCRNQKELGKFSGKEGLIIIEAFCWPIEQGSKPDTNILCYYCVKWIKKWMKKQEASNAG